MAETEFTSSEEWANVRRQYYVASDGYVLCDSQSPNPASMQDVRTSGTYGQSALIDQRTKPQDLVRNPTAQPFQYTNYWETGIAEQRDTNGCHQLIDGNWEYQYNYLYEDYYFDPSWGAHIWPDPPDWALDARTKIKDYSVNLGVALAEYRETCTMFHKFAQGLYDASRIARGHLKRAKRLNWCQVPAAELMYSYGVEPLMNDLYDSVEKLRPLVAQPITKRLVVTKRAEHTSEYRPTLPATFVDTEWEASMDISARTILYVEFEPEARSFTAGNPAEILWEVVPFSFVWDWGQPIGEWLSSLDALKDVKGVSGTTTIKRKYKHSEWQYRPQALWYSSPTYVKGSKPAILEHESHVRTVVDTIPVPPFPKWEPSLSYRRVMNGLALMGALSKPCRTRKSHYAYNL